MIPTWTLEDRLRKARISAGLRQADLASRLYVSRNTICSYETGDVAQSDDRVRAWAKATRVDADWLLGNDWH